MSEAFTDNSGLNSDSEDRNSDFTTQISPNLSIVGEGGRSSLTLDYTFTQTLYHRNTQGDENNNELSATGQVELLKRIFFVDGQATISQVVEDETRVSSDSATGRNINRTEARSFNVSPFFRQHFGQWLETEPRFTFNRTTTDSGLVEDTKTRTAAITVNSGRRFAIFPWSVVAIDRKTQNDGSQPSEYERRVDGSFSYVLDRKLTLTGTVGWEDIEDVGLIDQPKGVTWSGGFTVRPSSRTSMQFSYGDRNGDRDISFNASHRISERTSVEASYSETIETSQGLLDPALPAAPLTGFGLSESTFRQKVFRLDFSGSRRRNTFSGGGFWEQRDTESTGVRAINYGGNLELSRRLSSRLDGSIGIGIQTTDFGTADDREEIDYSASTSLSYQVRNDIQAILSYNLTLTKVNNAPDDLLENAVSIGLTKSF